MELEHRRSRKRRLTAVLGGRLPKRNLSEKTIGRRIAEIVARLNADGIPATGGKLPGSGEESLFIENGAVVTRQQKSAWNRTKSIDFFIAAMGQRVLIPAKYTVGDGGSQDNQRIDLHGVIGAAANLQAPDALIAVADGSHYSKPRPSGTTHFHDLSVQAAACGPRVKVSQYADLDHDVYRMLGL